MINSKQEVYKEYILKNFMNAPSNKHLETAIHESNNDLDTNPNLQEEVIIRQQDDNVTFTYLENDTLSNNVEYERDYYKDYQMHLCLYKVDTTMRLPFLKYLVKKDEQYVFPNQKMEMRPLIDSVNRNSDQRVDTLFMQQIHAFYKDITNKEIDHSKYKGYIENDKNDLFIFIDTSNDMINYEREYEYIIIDEILNTGIVRNTNINKRIIDLFKNNVFLQTIRTEQVLKTQFPKIGYIIKQDENGNQMNLFKKDNKDTMLVFPKIYHQQYHYIYLFSSIPLSVENINKLYRFACFVENFDNDEKMDNQVFEENDIQYYALKNMDLFTEL